MKKSHKSYLKTLSSKKNYLNFGSIGFKIMSSISITQNQLDSLKRALEKKLKILVGSSLFYKFWDLIFINKNLTKLSLESRMGKGKGSIYTKGTFLKAGSIIYEFENINYQQSKELFFFLKKQFPRTKLCLIRNKFKERET